MKMIFRLNFLMLSTVPMLFLNICKAQEADTVKDAIILKRGDTFVGKLLERTHQDTVLLQVEEGQILKFYRPLVGTITKETVLRDYIPSGMLVEPQFIISPGFGANANEMYGTVIGLTVRYLFGSRFYAGASVLRHFGTTVQANPTLHYPSGTGPQLVPHRTSLTEKTRGMMGNIVFGLQMGKGDLRVRPFVGCGVALLESAISYRDTVFEDSQYENIFVDYPIRGKTWFLAVPLGVSFEYRVVEHLLAGIDLHHQFIGSFSSESKIDKEYRSFLEKSENVFSVLVRVSLEL